MPTNYVIPYDAIVDENKLTSICYKNYLGASYFGIVQNICNHAKILPP